MGLNVTGQEVASGVHDPSVMFVVAAVIIIGGALAYAIYQMVINLK